MFFIINGLIKWLKYVIINSGDIMKQNKIIYMGTTIFSAHILEELIKNEYNIVALVSQPDRKVGRKQELKATATKEVALKYGVDVLSYENINEHVKELSEYDADLVITCAFGQKLKKEVLDLPRLKCVNVHASRLPLYRGGAPIHYAVMNGDNFSGNTIMYMEETLDSGAMLAMSKVTIEQDDTTAILHDKLMLDGAKLLLDTLPNILNENVNPIEQIHEDATFAGNITRAQEFIDFNRNVDEVYNHMRGLITVPGCYAIIENKKIKFHEIKKELDDHNYKLGEVLIDSNEYFKIFTKNGYIKIFSFQLEGKKRVDFKDYLNGNKLEIVSGIVLNEGV